MSNAVFAVRDVESAWGSELEEAGLREGPWNTMVQIVEVRLGNGKTARLAAPSWFVDTAVTKASTPPRFNVYFIRRGETGPIKIGVAVDPLKRLQELQTGNAERLRLLMVFPGGKKVESELHRRFNAFRLTGEWFAPVPELLEYISSVVGAA